MLLLDVKEKERIWEIDEYTMNITTIGGYTIGLEHSLKSIFDWEAVYKKSFLSTKLTNEEFLSYISYMVLPKYKKYFNISHLSNDEINLIFNYIKETPSATIIGTRASQENQNGYTKQMGEERITAEYIYALMAISGIPFSCDKWHINRLLYVLQIISIKNNPQKMSKQDLGKYNTALNAQRKAALKTRG